MSIFDSREDLELSRAQMRDNKALFPHVVFVNWTPSASAIKEEEEAAGSHRNATVPFAEPVRGKNYSGYVNATFNVEWMPIECSGELHIAYSLIDDSVRQKRPVYMVKGERFTIAKPASPTVTSVPIRAVVRRGVTVIGEFADDAAGKALGFGCFSGQTKKVAKIADLRIFGTDKPPKEEVAKYLESLDVDFTTPMVLTSTFAEAEIKAGNAEADKAKAEISPKDTGPSAADLAAEARAQREAEFQAKQADYERKLAEQQQAVAEYEEAKRKMAEQAKANAAAAQAVQAEFARQQAQHEAEMEAFRKAQADYEAKLKAMNSPQR